MIELKYSLRSENKRKKSLGTLILTLVTEAPPTWPDLTEVRPTTSQWH